jgi:predicted Zn-dependent protease
MRKMSREKRVVNVEPMKLGRVFHRALGSILVAGLLAGLGGCVVNPVTGERELGFVTSAQEIAIGREQYVPAQQMQGGAYKTDPVLTAYVSRVGNRLATASGVDLPYEFVVLNNSVPNAWALPGGKIALNRGLLVELRNEAELAAVLGHEIAHAAARHGAKRIERGIVTQGAMVALAVGTSGKEYAGQVLGGAQLAAGLLNQRYSRDAEREADYYGTEFMAKAGYDPHAAVTLQETFVRLSGEKRMDWLQGLFASHPPSTERVSNNRLLVRRLKNEGFSGDFNQPQFESAMGRLRKVQDAYDEYDGAVALYGEGEFDAALNQVNAALAIENGEALFHGLRGSIRLKQDRMDDAITNFDRAIARDPAYFVYYLSRGMAHWKTGSKDRAKRDLTQSVNLLPTATAYQVLGQLAEADGDDEAALRYYAAAAEAPGAVGQTAMASMLKLELPRNPAKYIRTRVTRDAEGRLVLQVTNAARMAVANVTVRVEVQTPSGTKMRTEVVPRIGAGESRVSLVGIGDVMVQAAQAYPVTATLAQ